MSYEDKDLQSRVEIENVRDRGHTGLKESLRSSHKPNKVYQQSTTSRKSKDE